MTQHHIVMGLHHLLVAIIIALFTGQRESVTLHHADMAPCLKRIARLEEIGTITIETGTIVLKLHVTRQHLSIVVLPAVIAQFISMQQVDALRVLLLWWLGIEIQTVELTTGLG